MIWTRTKVAGIAATAAALVMLNPAAAPAVVVDQPYPAPDSGAYFVTGHGYGHGHGMSQHGAQGAARQGLTHEQILAFYYPGTSLEEMGGKIRVLVTGDTTTDLVVDSAPGLVLRDLGTGKRYVLPTDRGAKRWKLGVNAKGRTVVRYRTSARWKRWRPPGRATLVGDGQLKAAGALTLRTPAGARTYRGVLRAASPVPGGRARDTVNVLSLERYVRGVVAREMPASWEPEAVQAQAVAARTYAARSRSDNAGRYYQICDTTACQVYGGKADEHPLSDAAVAATRGQVLAYGGEPAFAQFSSSSGGWTSVGSQPYLVAKEDPYDDWSGNTVHDWSTSLPVARIERAYPAIGSLVRIVVTSRDGNGQWQGRVQSMTLVGADGEVTVTGDTFRFVFGLRSTWFTLA